MLTIKTTFSLNFGLVINYYWIISTHIFLLYRNVRKVTSPPGFGLLIKLGLISILYPFSPSVIHNYWFFFNNQLCIFSRRLRRIRVRRKQSRRSPTRSFLFSWRQRSSRWASADRPPVPNLPTHLPRSWSSEGTHGHGSWTPAAEPATTAKSKTFSETTTAVNAFDSEASADSKVIDAERSWRKFGHLSHLR